MLEPMSVRLPMVLDDHSELQQIWRSHVSVFKLIGAYKIIPLLIDLPIQSYFIKNFRVSIQFKLIMNSLSMIS